MPWGVAAAAVGLAGDIYASNKGAKAQEKTSKESIAEQKRQFDIAQRNQAPFLQAGQNALDLQRRYLSGDTSGFMNSPDYRFALSQGLGSLDAGAAARGNLWGGGTDADRIRFGEGLATQYANNYWNKLAGMAGQGQVSAQNLGGLGANMANQIGANLTNAGQARASSYAANANAWNSFGNQIGNLYGQNMYGGMAPINANVGAPQYTGANLNFGTPQYSIQNPTPQGVSSVSF